MSIHTNKIYKFFFSRHIHKSVLEPLLPFPIITLMYTHFMLH